MYIPYFVWGILGIFFRAWLTRIAERTWGSVEKCESCLTFATAADIKLTNGVEYHTFQNMKIPDVRLKGSDFQVRGLLAWYITQIPKPEEKKIRAKQKQRAYMRVNG